MKKICNLCGVSSTEYWNTSDNGVWCKDCASECPGFGIDCNTLVRPSHKYAPYCGTCIAHCETCKELIIPFRHKRDYVECWKCEKERVKHSSLQPFCPKCGTLSYPNPSYEIKCTNYKCGYSGPICEVKNRIKPNFVSRSMQFTIDKDEFLTIESRIKNMDGYFEWPSTQLNPSFTNRSCTSVFDRVEKSPMMLVGYNVNQEENLTEKERRKLLRYCFKSSILPWTGTEEYMMNWGPANSAARLKRMSNHMARMGREMRRRGHKKALRKYDDDLSYLKKKYYEPMFEFRWPSFDDDFFD